MNESDRQRAEWGGEATHLPVCVWWWQAQCKTCLAPVLSGGKSASNACTESQLSHIGKGHNGGGG